MIAAAPAAKTSAAVEPLMPIPPKEHLTNSRGEVFQYWFADGKHDWGYNPTTFYNHVSMDRSSLKGDLGDWRAGGPCRWTIKEVLEGKADSDLHFHFGEKTLEHIKLVAAAVDRANQHP